MHATPAAVTSRSLKHLQGHYKSLGEHVQAVKLEHMKSQLAHFKSSLEQFAIKHRCWRLHKNSCFVAWRVQNKSFRWWQ